MIFVTEKLEKITSLLRTGKTPPTKNHDYFNGEINWYGPSDLDKGPFLGVSQRTITKKAVSEKKASLIPSNSILLGCIGDVGKIGMIKDVATSNQQITAIKPNEKVDFRYLFYWLKANKELLRANATNAILPILNNKALNAIKVSYPKSLDDQKRIAQVLTDCEELIAKRKDSIALLDELLKSTFLEMFGDSVLNQTKFPEKKIKELCLEIVDCPHSTPKYQDEITNFPCIRTSEIKDGYIDWASMRYTDEKVYLKRVLRLVPKEGDIIFAREGLVGEAAVIPNGVNLSLGQRVMLMRLDTSIAIPKFFWALLRSNGIQFKIQKKTIGATVKRINIGELKEIKCPIPPVNLQLEFLKIIEKLEETQKLYQTHLTELENLYRRLSQDAFKGELDLSKVVLREGFLKEESNFKITQGSSNIKVKNSIDKTWPTTDPFSKDGPNFYPEIGSDGLVKTEEDYNTEFQSKKNESTSRLEAPHATIEYEEEKKKKLTKKEINEYKSNLKRKKRKKNITNTSLADFLGVPDEIQNTRENIDFDFGLDNLFFQFTLKDTFRKGETFSFEEIEKRLHNYFYYKGDMDFPYEEFKNAIFTFLTSTPPLLEQFFDENDAQIKLKLTNEAFKA